MEPGDSGLEDRVEELESETDQHREWLQKMMPDRRGVIKGLGAAAIGGAAVGGATGGASGQSAAGQVGTSSEPVDVEAANVNAGSVNTESVSNTYYLNRWPGSTLNKMWDNLRSTFTAQVPKHVVLGPPTSDDEAGYTDGGTWTEPRGWKVDGPLVIDDAENNLRLNLGRNKLFATATMDSFLNISPTNKTEDIDVLGGLFAPKGLADKAVRIRGGARLRFWSIMTAAVAGNEMSYGVYIDAGTSSAGEITVDSSSFDGVSDASIHSAESNDLTVRSVEGTGNNVVNLEGPTAGFHLSKISGDSSDPGVTTSVVRLAATSAGRPRKGKISDVQTGQPVVGVLSEDTTGGVAAKMNTITIEDVNILDGNATQFDLDHISNCRVDSVGIVGNDPILRAGSADMNVRDGWGRGTAKFTDSGTNNTITNM